MPRGCWIIALLCPLLGMAACPGKSAKKEAPAAEASTPGEAPPRKVGPEQTPKTGDGWSEVVDGLQIRAAAPEGTASPGSALAVTLMFHNADTKPRRIYLVKGEPFRTMQSTLVLEDAGPPPPSQPPPAGYVVTEADFPELAPDETRTFTQTLRIPRDLAPGRHAVRWEYTNDLERWEGGSLTIDGYTKPLFGGKPIPGIWRGELRARFDVVVGKK